jgi:hypothetical protein
MFLVCTALVEQQNWILARLFERIDGNSEFQTLVSPTEMLTIYTPANEETLSLKYIQHGMSGKII